MPISLPPQIAALMTSSVEWESFQGMDGHAEPRYLQPIALACWTEPHTTATAGAEAYRRQDGTVVEPVYDCYLSGDDPNVRKIQLFDRFLIHGVGVSSHQKLQAVRVEFRNGPNFDNKNPWLVIVTL